ncbi:MAG: hypothetical protein ACOY9Y_08890 [Bacillota bacterium]
MDSKMPIRFCQGEIKKLLVHFNMKAEKGSTIFCGLGKDGIWRTCKFDYHKDKAPVATGTAKAIASSLKFKTVLEMKAYIDEHL